MAKDKSVVASDRREEIKALLSPRDLTPEKFLKICFDQEDIDRVDINKFAGNSWTPSKVDAVSVGFDPSTIEEYVLTKHGPARYRFSPVRGGEFLTHRVWAFGDVQDGPAATGPGAAFLPPPTDEPEDLHREVARHLKERSSLAALKEVVNDSEAASLERSIAPAKMMLEMMTMLRESLAKPGADAGMTTIFTTMMTTMMTLLTTVMSQSQAAQNENTKLLLAMMEDSKRAAREPGSFTKIVEALGVMQDKLGEGLLEAVQGRDKGEGGSVVLQALTAAAPILERVAEAIVQRTAGAPAPAALPPGTGPALPHTPAATGATTMALPLHPDPETNALLVEAASMGVEALKARDFNTLRAMLLTNFPDFMAAIDFDANSNIYLLTLRRLDPRFGELRAEFGAFFQWLEAESEGEDETPPPAPGQPA